MELQTADVLILKALLIICFLCYRHVNMFDAIGTVHMIVNNQICIITEYYFMLPIAHDYIVAPANV